MLKNGVLGRAAVGAWIEISFRETQKKLAKVAPPVGAWIEIGEVYDTDNTSGVAPPVRLSEN